MSNDNISTDEVRRQLRAVDRANDDRHAPLAGGARTHHGW